MDLDKLFEMLKEFSRSEYERGVRDGAEAMRQSIINAASQGSWEMLTPISPIERRPIVYDTDSGDVPAAVPEQKPSRAPRGAVDRAIGQVLKVHPGLTAQEVEEAALAFDPEVSRKSVGNNLRRLEGVKYRRDKPGGYHWFLIDDVENGTAGTQEARDPAAT